MNYTPASAGGTYEHRGWDCPVHGANVPFWKPYKARQPFKCVECTTHGVVMNPVARVYWYTKVYVGKGQWLRTTAPKETSAGASEGT